MTGRDGASTEVQRQREPTAGNTPLCPTHGLEVDRQTFIKRALALALGSAPVAVLLAACGGRAGDGMGEGMGDGMMDGGMPDWMMSHGRLLLEHEDINRKVEEIPNVIRSTTVSRRPEITDSIRTHVRQMKARVEAGEPIRQMDRGQDNPVFREIFEHDAKIRMDVEDIPGGARVTETSDDPQIVLLIRQHAQRARVGGGLGAHPRGGRSRHVSSSATG